uniref:long-chain-fatty-acid--CoA ligase n=1 Tax=Plectus sambesii TaxID=2011161 RepID=A0A914VPZ3_9BILA
RNVENTDGKLLTEVYPGCDTINKMWEKMVKKYGDANCLGTREVIKVHQEKQDNGRVFEKLELGEYLWESYVEVNDRSKAIASGLLDIGHKRGENLVIFADTRAEWMITALACFRSGIP